MRDVLLVTFMIALLPLILWRPAWGALAWVWFGLMNPHRLTWGFAQTLPFAQAIGIATVIGALFSPEPKRLKGGACDIRPVSAGRVHHLHDLLRPHSRSCLADARARR